MSYSTESGLLYDTIVEHLTRSANVEKVAVRLSALPAVLSPDMILGLRDYVRGEQRLHDEIDDACSSVRDERAFCRGCLSHVWISR